MKQKYSTQTLIALITEILLLIAAIAAAISTYSNAVAEEAADSAKLIYAVSLIAVIVLAVMIITMVMNFSNKTGGTKKLEAKAMAQAALCAALCYIGFTFFKIDIPVGTEKTAFHLGNVFCVLAALLIGGYWGGLAGAVGMTFADLTTGYVTSAPKTFLLKLCIGFIVGFVAHKIFKLSHEHSGRYIACTAFAASAAGMVFNVFADPIVGYFYKTYLLGVPQEAAKIWAKIGAVTTLVNAIVAIICASIFYLALRPALLKSGLLTKIEK